jgi:hypothetical protein
MECGVSYSLSTFINSVPSTLKKVCPSHIWMVVKLGESLSFKEVEEGDGEILASHKWDCQMKVFSSSRNKVRRRSKKNLR